MRPTGSAVRVCLRRHILRATLAPASACFVLYCLTVPARVDSKEATLPRFFFSGNGQLKMHHAHFEEVLDVRYRDAHGAYNPGALEQVAYFFRSRGDAQTRPVALRLVELLSYLQQHYHARPMILLSGYRSPEYNDSLGAQGQAVAYASLHTQALAADIALPGQNLRRLWLRLRELGVGGVGLYERQGFLHVDVGPPRFWEETTSRVRENLSAGNARVFARTDFDRYWSLQGARIALHSVTALPLRVHREVFCGDEKNGACGRMEPVTAGIIQEDNCWLISEPLDSYEFIVGSVTYSNRRMWQGRSPLRLHTCPPRIERTPETIFTNAVELY